MQIGCFSFDYSNIKIFFDSFKLLVTTSNNWSWAIWKCDVFSHCILVFIDQINTTKKKIIQIFQ